MNIITYINNIPVLIAKRVIDCEFSKIFVVIATCTITDTSTLDKLIKVNDYTNLVLNIYDTKENKCYVISDIDNITIDYYDTFFNITISKYKNGGQ